MTPVQPLDVLRPEGMPSTAAPGRVRVAAVQTDPRLGAPSRNLERALEAIELARAEGARLIVFPECALTGYCVSSLEEARSIAIETQGPVIDRLARAGAGAGVSVVTGYLERTPTGVANAVSILEKGAVVGHYRKAHLPHLGADRYTEPGREPFRVFEAAGLRVGLLICYDASFPEASRLLTLAGADLILLPTNWPEEAELKAGWLPNARAYENVVYFAAVNRVGEEGGFRFHGASRVCDPTGATVIEGPRDREAVLLADVDPARARTKRIVRRDGYWVDRIGQRREDLYRLTPGSAIPEEGSGE